MLLSSLSEICIAISSGHLHSQVTEWGDAGEERGESDYHMINKSFDLVDKSDVDALVTNEVAEGRTLEYKEILPSGSNDDKKEFLADVSAFANAAGGDILYGITEKRDANGKTTGIPEAANGLARINVDEVTRRLDSMILDGIAPRINGIRTKAIEGFASGPVLLVRIPKS
ncbi:hypothetical protein TFLX_02826 [Thermoflexales bacterium]|nr:hypothetical protein TFLX_02826 [Thermoflexales bacterium]